MDKLAIVTGTSRGLGLAVARELLDRDWRVAGVARSPAPAELARSGYRHARLDLSDVEAASAWFEGPFREEFARSGADRLGLVNNAGVLEPMEPLATAGAAALSRSFAVNVVAPAWLMGFALRLAPLARLRVVNVSSGAAVNPYPGWAAYCAGKAALRMAGQVLGLEAAEVPALAGRDLAVVAYPPHVVATAMQEAIRATSPEQFPRRQKFALLHESGALVTPDGPAAEIAELLGSDGLPPFSERRYEP